MDRRKSDTGQALILVAVSLFVLLGFLGLGIDLGYMRYVQRQMQILADAAAIAGAKEIQACAGTADCSTLTTAATKALVENGITSPTADTSCTPAPTLGATNLTVKNGPSCGATLGFTDPHNGDANYVEAIVAQKVSTNFAKVLGFQSLTISARGEAGLANTTDCLYALSLNGHKTLDISASEVDFPNCTVIVNSNFPNAVHCTKGPKVVTFEAIKFGASHTTGSCFFTDSEVDNSPPVPDPLAYLTAPSLPSAGACTTVGSTTSCTAGLYSSTLSITSGTANFAAGTYYLKNGITISGASTTASGTGVTFYVSGGTVSIEGGVTSGTVQFAAPTDKSNSLYGILFWQPSSNTNDATFGGADASYFTGALYFPGANLTIGGTTVNYNKSATYTILLADSVSLPGNGTYGAPSAGASPVKIVSLGE